MTTKAKDTPLPPMQTPPNQMQGFSPVTADQRGSQVQKEDLTAGAIVKYLSSRYVDTPRAKGNIHTFKTRGGINGGLAFSLWGTGELDDILAKVPAGAILFLQYGGKHPHPELPGAEMHKWIVQVSRAKEMTDDIRSYIRERADIERRLEIAVDASRAKASARFEERQREAADRGEVAPPHTDDDLPF